MLTAVFLMFLFPAIFLHVQAKENICAAWISKLEEYEEIIQKQGYIEQSLLESLDIKYFNGFGSEISGLDTEIWHQMADGSTVIVNKEILENNGIYYLDKLVYPLHTGEVLEFRTKLPFDFLEKLFYVFCRIEGVKSHTNYVVIRDGVLERLEGAQ